MPEITVSQQYHQLVSKLYQEHLEHQITDQELSQRLDEANEEEAKRQKYAGPVLIKQALTTINQNILEEQTKVLHTKQQEEKDEQDRQNWIKLQEQKAREKKERDEQKAREREQARKEQEWRDFREEIKWDIRKREVSAQTFQQYYNVLQIILLVFSAITATMAGIDGIARGWVALTGVIATIAGGILTTFKIQDRIYANRKAVTELGMECQKYDYHIDEYKGTNAEDAFIKFTRTISGIQGEQMLQEVELWNPKRDKRDENKKNQPNPPADTQEANGAEQASGEMLKQQEESTKVLFPAAPEPLQETSS